MAKVKLTLFKKYLIHTFEYIIIIYKNKIIHKKDLVVKKE
jgi:hypothetical protein